MLIYSSSVNQQSFFGWTMRMKRILMQGIYSWYSFQPYLYHEIYRVKTKKVHDSLIHRLKTQNISLYLGKTDEKVLFNGRTTKRGGG